MLWVVKDKTRGIVLFSGEKPEKQLDGTYLSLKGPIGKIPKKELGINLDKIDEPIPVSLEIIQKEK